MKYKDLRGSTFGLCLGVTSKGKIYYENREIIKKEQKYYHQNLNSKYIQRVLSRYKDRWGIVNYIL